MQRRASWVVTKRTSWRKTCTATSKGYSGTRIQSLGRSCRPPAALHSYPCVPCTKRCYSEGDLGGTFPTEQKGGVLLLGKMKFSITRDYSKMTKSYQEWRFFLNPDSLNEQGQATMWSTTRCSTWLKYLYSASTFFEDWKVLKANLRKKKMWKGNSYGKTRNSRSTIAMSERTNGIFFWCGLWWPGRTFISLWRIDTVCVNEVKGDLISIGTLLEGRLDFFYYSYGGLNEYIHFWGVVKSVC